jgi:Plasmid pRiA4b ORF-3-like protein
MASRPSLTPRAVARRVKQLTRLQYQLHIELNEVQPQVWRRLLVPEDVTLIKLNVILQQAMGWLGGRYRLPVAAILGGTAAGSVRLSE